MRNQALVIAFAICGSAVVSGCSSNHLLGEDSCFGEQTRCESDAPTIPGFGISSPFDVVPTRTLTPRWTTPLPCADQCLPQLQAGSDGTLWAYVLESKQNRLFELDDDGSLVNSYQTARPGLLTTDEALEPHVTRWEQDGRFTLASRDESSVLAERTLPIAAQPRTGSTLISLDRDGSTNVAVFDAKESFVARYDASGALLWKQNNLRMARRFPFEDLGPGIVPFVNYSLLSLGDGSVLVGVPKYVGEDAEERGPTNRYDGFTLLDGEGNVRWDAMLGITTTLGSVRPLLAKGPDAWFAVAVGSQNALFVRAVDSAGEILGVWMGQRVGYHALTPGTLCVDSAGVIYVAMIGGERDDRRYMLCKFDSAAPEAEPSCATVELPEPLQPQNDQLGALGFSLAGMACPAPGHVVLAPLPFDPERGQLLVGLEF